MFIVGLFFGIALGVLIREVYIRYSTKEEDDWEIYDAVTGKWTIKREGGVVTNEEFAWYEIYYSPSKDYYKLQMGGYDPKGHSIYRDVVKTLRENNQAARVRKDPFGPDKCDYEIEKKKDPIVEHEKKGKAHKH